jgi:hypothetical protein
MKTTVQYEKQVLALARAYQEITLVLRAEVSHACSDFISQIEALTRIMMRDMRDLNAPVKKGAKNHGVRVRRGR